jgi:hypothetical protein
MNALRKKFVGKLSGIINKFLMHKKSLGFKYILQEDLLYRFSIFSLGYKIPDKTIPRKLVDGQLLSIPFKKTRNRCIEYLTLDARCYRPLYFILNSRVKFQIEVVKTYKKPGL